MVRLGNDTLVRSQDDLCSLRVQVKGTQDEDEPGKAGETLNALLPVVVKVEQKHLRFCSFQYAITELLDLEARLERKLQLATLDHDVWEV